MNPSQFTKHYVKPSTLEAKCTGVLLAEVVDQGHAGYTFEIHLANGRSIVVSYELAEAKEAIVGIYDTKKWREGGEGQLARLDIGPSKISYEEDKSCDLPHNK